MTVKPDQSKEPYAAPEAAVLEMNPESAILQMSGGKYPGWTPEDV